MKFDYFNRQCDEDLLDHVRNDC
jgi:hypothetical protein